jgi:hypothetical protein
MACDIFCSSSDQQSPPNGGTLGTIAASITADAQFVTRTLIRDLAASGAPKANW